MSAATGGGMGINKLELDYGLPYAVRCPECQAERGAACVRVLSTGELRNWPHTMRGELAEKTFQLDHVAALQELQARNVELERRALIAEQAYITEMPIDTPDFKKDFQRGLDLAEQQLIEMGKIQPTEPGGQQ